MRPARNDLCNVFLSHFFAEQRLFALGAFCGGVGQFLFELGNFSVLNLACSGQLAAALRALELSPKSIEFFLPFSLLF